MLTFHKDTSFYANAFQTIKGSEGLEPTIYPDSINIPTTGYGYAMIVKTGVDKAGKPTFAPSEFVKADFLTIGITLTGSHITALEKIADDLTKGNDTIAKSETR